MNVILLGLDEPSVLAYPIRLEQGDVFHKVLEETLGFLKSLFLPLLTIVVVIEVELTEFGIHFSRQKLLLRFISCDERLGALVDSHENEIFSLLLVLIGHVQIDGHVTFIFELS